MLLNIPRTAATRGVDPGWLSSKSRRRLKAQPTTFELWRPFGNTSCSNTRIDWKQKAEITAAPFGSKRRCLCCEANGSAGQQGPPKSQGMHGCRLLPAVWVEVGVGAALGEPSRPLKDLVSLDATGRPDRRQTGGECLLTVDAGGSPTSRSAQPASALSTKQPPERAFRISVPGHATIRRRNIGRA